MACEHDSVDENATLQLGTPNGPQVRLWNRVDPWSDGSVRICAQLTLATDTERLAATAHDITVGVAEEPLSEFLTDLAESYAGWTSIRTWQNLNRDLRIEATHTTGGYVDLTWTLSSRPYPSQSSWSATLTVRLEAGEQMRRAAATMHRFLTTAS